MRSLITVCAAVFALAAPAAAQPTRVGGKAGASFQQLSQPADPAGEPTVLFGTAFTGFGFQAGATASRDLVQLGFGPLYLTADLLISHQRGSGYAESRTSNARRTVTIHTTGLRVPLLLAVGFKGGSSLVNLALGPELLAGLHAGSKTTQTGAEAGALLAVRPVTHVGLTAQLGMIFEVNRTLMPIDARFTWDPFVAASTRDRFDNYVDFDNPGAYAVAFNWQAFVNVGWLFTLGRNAEHTPPGVPEPVDEPPPVRPKDPAPEEDPDFG